MAIDLVAALICSVMVIFSFSADFLIVEDVETGKFTYWQVPRALRAVGASVGTFGLLFIIFIGV